MHPHILKEMMGEKCAYPSEVSICDFLLPSKEEGRSPHRSIHRCVWVHQGDQYLLKKFDLLLRVSSQSFEQRLGPGHSDTNVVAVITGLVMLSGSGAFGAFFHFHPTKMQV